MESEACSRRVHDDDDKDRHDASFVSSSSWSRLAMMAIVVDTILVSKKVWAKAIHQTRSTTTSDQIKIASGAMLAS